MGLKVEEFSGEDLGCCPHEFRREVNRPVIHEHVDA
jgi:hypothetical protein